MRGSANQARGEVFQRPLIFWKCYSKVHIATQLKLDYDTRSDEVVHNNEALTLEEMGEVSPGAYFRLKQLVTAKNAKNRGTIQLILRKHNP